MIVYEIIYIGVICLLHILAIWLLDDDGYWEKKRVEKRIEDIERYQRREQVKNITFSHKGKEFSVYIKPLEEDRCFKKTSVWINGECALVVYTLIGLFVNCRAMMYAEKRKECEIREIIKVASETANKRVDESIKNHISLICKTNSYFNDKEV